MSADRLLIGLLWHSFSSDNLGVGAISLANVSLLREAARAQGREVAFLWLGPDGGLDYLNQAEAELHRLPYSLRRPRELIRRLRQCDAIFDISAGDSFTDLYGRRRFFHLAYTKLCALLSGRPLVLSPQTIGPFASPAARVVAARIMKRCARVFTRDDESVKHVPAGAPVSPSTDVAFALPYRRQAPARGRPRVGLGVSGLLYNGGYTRANMFRLRLDYAGFCRALIEFFLAEGGEVHLVGHVNSEAIAVEDDHRACRELNRCYPETVLVPRFSDPIQAKSYIAGLDYFTGARMHATIAAFSTGVPVVPVSYSPKFAGLYGSLGFRSVVDGRSMTEQEALEVVTRAFRDRRRMRAETGAMRDRAQARARVYESYASTLVGGL